jgi:Tfp pilus assembly PilM family ATPase
LRSTLNSKMMLAVDWDAKRLRVVHAGLRKGKVRVERMLSVDIPPEVDMSEPESAGKLLREVLAKLKIRTKRVILDVPRDQALLTTLNLPAASPDDMPALVEFQIAKELPFRWRRRSSISPCRTFPRARPRSTCWWGRCAARWWRIIRRPARRPT